MKAFAELLCPCGCVLIRVGPDTDKAPKDYDYMVALSPGDVLKGMTRNPDKETETFTTRHMRALKAVIKALKRKWRFDRYNHDNERTISMARQNREQRPRGRRMPHPDEARKSDGTIDKDKAKAGAMEAMAAFESGEYELLDMDESGIAGTDIEVFTVYRRKAKK